NLTMPTAVIETMTGKVVEYARIESASIGGAKGAESKTPANANSKKRASARANRCFHSWRSLRNRATFNIAATIRFNIKCSRKSSKMKFSFAKPNRRTKKSGKERRTASIN